MKAKLIALDIDGTILDKPSGFGVPAAVRDAAQEARLGGARVCLCSSRPWFFMKDATDGLGRVDALIGCSGASIAIDRETSASADAIPAFEPVFNDILPESIVNACAVLAAKLDIYASFGGREKILARIIDGAGQKLIDDPNFSFMKDSELLSALRSEPVSCVYLFTKPGMPNEAITNAPGLEHTSIHKSSENSFTITSKGVDKGSGLLFLASYWGIPQELTLAVGNDENDVPVLKAAGVGVAVGNASPETLAAADWVAPDVWNAGAAEAIRRFAL